MHKNTQHSHRSLPCAYYRWPDSNIYDMIYATICKFTQQHQQKGCTASNWLVDLHLLHLLNCVSSSPFLSNMKWKKTNFSLISPQIDYKLSLCLFGICVHVCLCACNTHPHMFVSMRVCNPCGSAGTWRVRLAGVQPAVHEGLWWLLHLCLRHERRTQSQEGEVDAEKWGKYLWRKSKCLRDDGGRRGGAVIFADSNEKGVHRRERKKNWREQTGCVFVMDYFCGVASVCSSCGQWIMLEFMRMSICWSHSAFFCVSPQTQISNFYIPKGGDSVATALTSAWWHPTPSDRPAEVLWVCMSPEKRQIHCSNSQPAGSWQQSTCYTLLLPALIHSSGLQHDNPAHMHQPHTH